MSDIINWGKLKKKYMKINKKNQIVFDRYKTGRK